MKSAFLIAAPTSGSGKTTLARGLMALFTQQGHRVQPFKCGPDYIDTKFHEAVCHRPSINLDTFMATDEHVRELFRRYTQGGDDAPAWAHEPADVAVVEGMMGLFDGYDRYHGSCADIARVLDLPIVLVVDASSAAYSMAAILHGFIDFFPDLRFAGVIYNKVGSPRHAAMLREVAAEVGIACLGCIPKQAVLVQGSRYLGLDFSEHTQDEQLIHTLQENIDWQTLLENTSIREDQHVYTQTPSRPYVNADTSIRIFVARNAESFSFIYQETLDLLHQIGNVEFFDPEDPTDPPPALPVREGAVSFADCNPSSCLLHSTPSLTGRAGGGSAGAAGSAGSTGSALYLPGGYPERHLEALAKAEGMRRFIRDFAEAGGRIIAECGGMMYLCREIITDEGTYPMCGVLPYSITARQADRRLSLGYRQFTLDDHMFRGHEFHYTRFAEPQPASDVQVLNAKGEPVPTAVLRQGNIIASYTHLSPSDIVQAVKLLENNAQE